MLCNRLYCNHIGQPRLLHLIYPIRTMPDLINLSSFMRICGSCMCFCAVLGFSCRSCSTWRMTGSVMMFWISGSAMALARRCASSSSEASPDMNCKTRGLSECKQRNTMQSLQLG